MGCVFASADGGGGIKIWKSNQFEKLVLNSLSWNGNDHLLANRIGANTNYVSASQSRTWSCQHSLNVHALETTEERTNKGVNALCYLPDGYLASGSSTIQIWDIQNGTCIQILRGHKENITSLCFSYQTNKLFSGSNDCALKVWASCLGKLKGIRRVFLSEECQCGQCCYKIE